MSTFVQQEKLSGIVERVTFHSLDSGWSVLKVSPFNEPKKLTTVLIHQVKVFAGASMEFHGSWSTHQKYGDQFKATMAVERKPASAAALEKYLGSGLIKGVGPKTANKIVKFLGRRTLEVFENSMDELLAVPSIAEKKLAQIKTSWQEHRAIRDVMMFLQSHGVSTLFAVKIFKIYGNEAINIVSTNPYRLARDIYGIGFFSADRIALSMGFKKEGEQRIQAAIKHVLASSRDEGHCYLTMDQILAKTTEILELQDKELILNSLNNLLADDEIKTRRLPQGDNGFIDCFYSKSLYWDEVYVAKKISRLINSKVIVDEQRIQTWIKKYCQKSKVLLSEEQESSVFHITQKSFSILTGGPGCGKTTTTKALVQLLVAMKKKVVLAAPTGRAAQRMTEVIGRDAKTIHRLLEWQPQKSGFKKGEEEPLNADFLIIDECSMLDINLAASLLKAIPNGCQILFIGDPDQLPSVGAGAVLYDLLSVKQVPHFRLTEIFRQAAESSIIKYAHQINKGIIPKISSPLADPTLWERPVDCMFIDSEQASLEQLKFIGRAKKVIEKTLDGGLSHYLQTGSDLIGQIKELEGKISIEELYVPSFEENEPLTGPVFSIPEKFKHVDFEKLSQSTTETDELKEILKSIHPWSTLNYGYNAIDIILRIYTKTIKKKMGNQCEIQILTPQVRGTLGTTNLNRQIQEKINPLRDGNIQIKIGEKFYRVNDRVIQTRNNYDLNVFNGDIGSIVSINPEDYSSEIRFGDQKETIRYSKEDLTELNLAYAITIHKSQGSEFEAVIIPVTTQHFKMLFRNLIYTGLTRAKKLAIFVGSRKALALAVRSMDNRKRQTALGHLFSAGSASTVTSAASSASAPSAPFSVKPRLISPPGDIF